MSEWRKINSGVPQRLALGSLLFLVFINDLPYLITSICKNFAEDTFLFLKVHGIDMSTKELNAGLENISKWTLQWKMHFNPNPSKPANEAFFRQSQTAALPSVSFNNNDIKICSHKKHLGIVLDCRKSKNVVNS